MASKLTFSFGGDAKARTAEDLARERAIVDQLMSRSYAPKNLGEGLTAIGQALGARMANKRYEAHKAEANEGASKLWSSIFNSGAGANAGAPISDAPLAPIEPIEAGPVSDNKGVTFAKRLMSDLGVTPAAAAGFAGNTQAESGFQAINEKNPTVPGSRGGFGWNQWTGPRRVAFEQFAAANGMDPSKDEANYQFTLHELKNTPEKAVLAKLQGINDPAQAAQIVSENYLRPGIPHMENRVSFANQIAQAMPQPDGQPQPQPQAQPAQAETGMPSSQQLLGAMQHPSFGFLPQGQQQMIVELYKQQAQKAAQQADPAYQMGLKKQAIELDNLQNPKMSPYEQAQLQFNRDKFDFERAKLDPAWDELSNGNLFNKQTGEIKEVPQNGKPPKQTDDMREFDYSQQNPEFKQYLLDTKKAGATSVNVGGEVPDGELRKALNKKEGELWNEFQTAAGTSASTAQDMELLGELIKVAPQGPLTGRLAQLVPGVSSAGAAFQSIVNRVAPTLRVPGSGATSDIEYEGMLKSLPGLQNYPEANAAIQKMMTAKAQVNMERGSIVDAYANGEITAEYARKKIGELNKRSIMSPELKAALSGLGETPASKASTTAPKGVDPEVWDAMTEEERALWQN